MAGDEEMDDTVDETTEDDLEQDVDDSEDDEGDEDDDGGEGEEEAEVEDPAHVAARLQEKESQAAGLTVALRQERTARQAAMQRARVLEDRLYHVLDVAIANSNQGAAPEVGAGEDPEADILAQIEERVSKVVKPVVERLDKSDQAAAEQRVESAVEQVNSWVEQDRANGKEYLPGFEQAETLVGRRIYQDIAGEIQARRPGIDPDSLQQLATQVFNQRVASMQIEHAQRGVSFAQSLYNWAMQMGFAPDASPALERTRRGVSGSRGPSAAPAARRPMPRDARALLDLPDDEFADAIEQLGEKGFKSLLSSQEVSG